MKKFLTKMLGLALGLTMVLGVGIGIAGNKKASSVYAADDIAGYTLIAENNCPKSTTNSTYATNYNVTVDGIGWNAPGNQFADGDWRIGGAQGTNVSRVLYTTTAVSGTVNRIRVKWGTMSVTSFSATVTVHNNASDASTGSNVIATFNGSNSYAANSTKDLDDNTGWADKYYRISCTYTHSNSKNKYQALQSVAFYSKSATPSISFSSDEISGEEGDDFSFTWTESNLSSPITWAPANASTDIIDYEVNTATKTVSGTLVNAGEVTLTATSGTASDSIDFVVTEHQIHRKYTVTSTTAVSGSGDTITGASAGYSQTYSTAKQATSGNSMTLSLTGLTKKVSISKLVLSMHSNASAGAGSISVSVDGGSEDFIAGTSSSVGAGFNTFGDNTSYGNEYKDVTWDNLSYLAKSSIVIKIYCITTNSLYCESFDLFFTEQDNNDVVTALSISPNSWSGFDSQILNVASFTPSVTTNGAAGTALDYSYLGIGYMDNETFVARDADFSSGHPTVDDTRLCWKANYPTTVGGSTYIYAYVTLTVQADGVSTVSLSGSMSKTSYYTTDSWDKTGLVVTASYASGGNETVTASASFEYYRDSLMTDEIETPNDLGTGNNQTIYVKATYSNVSNTVGYSQTVSVSIEHGTLEGDPLNAAEAIEIGTPLANNAQTSKQYYIQGVVSEVVVNQLDEANESNKYATFWIKNGNETYGFEAYKIKADAGCTNHDELLVGAEVLMMGKIKKYSSTIETGTDAVILSITYSVQVLTGVTLNEEQLTLGTGKTFDLEAYPDPIGAELGDVSWVSSNSGIASVNASGTVTGVAAGSATITATAGGFTATCSVTVVLMDTMEYSGTTKNMTASGNASLVGLDTSLFTVDANKGGSSNFPGLNAAGDMRLYYDTSGNGDGNSFTVSIDPAYTITSINVDYKQNASYARVYADYSLVAGDAGAYNINKTSFTIKNVSTTSLQVQINSIDIAYRETNSRELLERNVENKTTISALRFDYEQDGLGYTFTEVGIRFGGFISQELWTNLNSESEILGYGVIVAETSALEGKTIQQLYGSAAGANVDAKLTAICNGTTIKKISVAISNEKPHPAEAEDEQIEFLGAAAGDYYIWTARKVITAGHFDTAYTAVAYIKTENGIVFLQQTASKSARDLAQIVANELPNNSRYKEPIDEFLVHD